MGIVVLILVFCFASVGCGFAQDLKTVKAEGMGMSPTIRDGDKLVIDQSFYERGNSVARFDIIPFMVSTDLFHYKTGHWVAE